jgi:hypothetical protein
VLVVDIDRLHHGRQELVAATAQQLTATWRLVPVLVMTDDVEWQEHDGKAHDSIYEVLPATPFTLDLMVDAVRMLRSHAPTCLPSLQGTF